MMLHHRLSCSMAQRRATATALGRVDLVARVCSLASQRSGQRLRHEAVRRLRPVVLELELGCRPFELRESQRRLHNPCTMRSV